MGSQKVFASVKSYSKRGRLLGRSDLQTLAESRDLDELVTRMKNTTYSDVAAAIPKPYTSRGIESALRAHLAEVHHSIARTAGGSKVLEAYYQKFLIWNLKIILKGKVLGKSQEELEPLINLRAEELSRQRDIILKALVSGGIDETVSSLAGTIYGAGAAKAAELYTETKNIQVFDTYLDKVWVEQLASGLKRSGERDLGRLVGMHIDYYNIMSALRGKFWGLAEQHIQDLLVTGTSRAPSDVLLRMVAAGTVQDALAELASTPYKDLIPQTEKDAVSEFERAFEVEIYTKAKNTFTRMFSEATSAGITVMTTYEARNISSIAYAVEQGISADTVMSKVIPGE